MQVAASALKAKQDEASALRRFDTRRNLIDFTAQEDANLAAAKDQAQPGAVGFREAWQKQNQARSQQFLQSVPADLRPEYEARIASTQRALGNQAGDFEYSERNRHLAEQTETGLGEVRSRIYADPERFGEHVSEGEALIDAQPISPIENDKQKAKWRLDAATAYGERIQDSVTDPNEARAVLGLPTTPEARETFAFKRLKTAVQLQESGGNPNAVSPVGALGPMQVMPDTARQIAGELHDPRFPTGGDADVGRYLSANNGAMGQIYGDYYLAKQVKAYGGDVEAALIAYNAGPARADQFLKAGRDWSVLPAETRKYVPSVLSKASLAGVGVTGHPDWEPSRPAREVLTGVLVGGKSAESVDNLSPVFANRLAVMFEMAPPGIRQGLGILSGYRSVEHQRELHDEAIRKYGRDDLPGHQVASPGHSQHNHGTAVDLSWNGASFKEAPPEVQAWVHQNAQKLGLSFPVAGEPWHVEPAEVRNGDGSVFPMDPRLAALPLEQRLKIARSVEKRRADVDVTERATVSSLVDDDLKSVEATGKGVQDLPPERVGAALGDAKQIDWLDRRQTAQRNFNALDGMEGLSADQLQTRVTRLAPEAGQAGFDAAQQVYETAEKRASEINKQRVEDPAASVAKLPEVTAAVAQQDDATPETKMASAQSVARARLAAQERIGIVPELRRPLTKEEAAAIAAPIKAAAQVSGDASGKGDWFSLVDKMSQSIGATYGDLGDDVFRQVVTELVDHDEDKAVYASRILQGMIAKQAPSIPDSKAVDDLNEAGKIEKGAAQFSGQSNPLLSDRNFSRGMDQAARAAVSGASPTALPKPKPSAAALRYLNDHPETLPDFISLYGARADKADQPQGSDTDLMGNSTGVGPQSSRDPFAREKDTGIQVASNDADAAFRMAAAASSPAPQQSAPRTFAGTNAFASGRDLAYSSKRQEDDDVKEVQSFLNDHNHTSVRVDGWYGKRTRAAVVAYQKSRGLEETGVADQATQDSMRSETTPGWVSAGSALAHTGVGLDEGGVQGLPPPATPALFEGVPNAKLPKGMKPGSPDEAVAAMNEIVTRSNNEWLKDHSYRLPKEDAGRLRYLMETAGYEFDANGHFAPIGAKKVASR